MVAVLSDMVTMPTGCTAVTQTPVNWEKVKAAQPVCILHLPVTVCCVLGYKTLQVAQCSCTFGTVGITVSYNTSLVLPER